MNHRSEVPIPIRTKLHRPRPTDDLVVRPRLNALLERGMAGKLTLVCAPAGFGKTTLVAAWLESCRCDTAWLTLAKNDSDLATFLLYVVTAIQDADPTACKQTERLLLAQPSHLFDSLAATFFNELAALSNSVVLVLDDYHFIRDELIRQFMARLIDAQPPQLHLVIVTRSDPLLPLPRLRVRRQMTEIRARDLRFSTDEAEQFLRLTMNNMDRELATALNRRTEGWPAGLRLAALSMHDVDDYAAIINGFQGDANRFVTEYLAAEVLAHQPPDRQDFLLQTSILDRFCADLCDAVTAQAPGQSRVQLNELTRANLFLTELNETVLDEEEGWYQYHQLFQEMLKQMLVSRTDPQAVEALHRRAGRWFAGRGDVEMALHHAQAIGDMAWAADMLEQNSLNPLNRVERHRWERWLSLLDDNVIWQRPHLLMAKAMQLYRQFRVSALDDLLDQADDALEQGRYTFPDNAEETFRGSLQAFRSSTWYTVRLDDRRANEAAEKALKWLPEGDYGGRGIALAFGALALQALGEKELAVARLNQAIDDPSHFGPAKPQALLGLAFLQYIAGDLAQMGQTTHRFQILAADLQQANVAGAAHYPSGFLAYELNDLEAAKKHFIAVGSVRHGTNLLAGSSCLLGLARIHQLHGELEAAQQIIDDVRVDVMRLQSTDLLDQVDALQALQMMLQDDVAQALRWARTVNPKRITAHFLFFQSPALARSRILITRGTDSDLHALRLELQAEIAGAEARHNRQRMIRCLAHLARVDEKLGRRSEALSALTRAVNLAQPGGFIRSFVDCGPALGPLLENLARQGVAPHYVAQLLNAFAAERSTARQSSPTSQNGPRRPISLFTPLVEPLTRREQEVLDLLQQGLTNREIADQLVISVHTAKRHVSNIYGKLGVNSRKQVLLRARQLGMI